MKQTIEYIKSSIIEDELSYYLLNFEYDEEGGDELLKVND